MSGINSPVWLTCSMCYGEGFVERHVPGLFAVAHPTYPARCPSCNAAGGKFVDSNHRDLIVTDTIPLPGGGVLLLQRSIITE
jgi:hypothetical protein